jgi:hypothetical protein
MLKFEQLEIPTKDKDGKDLLTSIINKSKHEFVPLWLVISKCKSSCNNFWTKYLW